MHGWVATDADGRTYLVRSGSGLVTALVPVGMPDAAGTYPFYSVEIDVAGSRTRAIRLTTGARVPSDDATLLRAQDHLAAQEPVEWVISWHRHQWIPAEVPITALDLRTDAQAWLLALHSVQSGTDDATQHALGLISTRKEQP